MKHERFKIRDKAALLRKARELGVELPFSDDIGALFTPINIAGRRVPNRFAVQPVEGRDAEPDGSPGALTFRRYRRFAAAGSGLIWFEATAVVPEGRACPAQLCISHANVDAFQRLVEQTRAAARESHGDAHDMLLVLQLTHAGRYSRPDGSPRPLIAQHSAILDPRTGIAPEHPLVGVARLLRITGDLQQAVPDLPIVGTGYSWLRRFFPNVGAAVVSSGKAAFIGLGRQAFAYPDCVKDLAERGALTPKKACVACSGCTQLMRDGGSTGCIVHDQEIYGEQYRAGRGRAGA